MTEDTRKAFENLKDTSGTSILDTEAILKKLLNRSTNKEVKDLLEWLYTLVKHCQIEMRYRKLI